MAGRRCEAANSGFGLPVRRATTGTQLAKLTAADAASQRQVSAASVAISGNTALVGASNRDDNGPPQLRLGLSLFDATTGNQLAKLTAADAAADDFFGSSVAISGNTALGRITAHDDDAGSRIRLGLSVRHHHRQPALLS